VSQLKRLRVQRRRRCFRVRNTIRRVSTRPRLCVFRSNKHIGAQIIDDAQGKTLVSASTREKEIREAISGYGGNVKAAEFVGRRVAERALEAGIKVAAFDRGPYRYHGRVAALADAARDAGLDLGAKKEPDAKAPKGAADNKAKKPGKGAQGEKSKKSAEKTANK